jgi:sugar lactone lactonase YvrE
VVGLTYYGESVPTDVERNPRGKLIVSTEGGGFGEQMPLGAVYRIDPGSGRTKLVAGKLFGPTGVAVGPRGKIFVAQLFANKISTIRPGSSRVRTFVRPVQPGAVELARGDVFATTRVLPPQDGQPDGRVVRYQR